MWVTVEVLSFIIMYNLSGFSSLWIGRSFITAENLLHYMRELLWKFQCKPLYTQIVCSDKWIKICVYNLDGDEKFSETESELESL